MAEPALRLPAAPEEWLAWEEVQPERYELIGDEPRLMAGGSLAHNTVALNLVTQLRQRLRGGPCRVNTGDVKVVLPGGRWTYPDVFVHCSARRSSDTWIDDPVLIVEVLSPSTEPYDMQTKRWAYQEIASLQQLVFVAQDRAKVEVVSRASGGAWRSVFCVGLEGEIVLEALGVSLPLAGVYEDVDLTAAEATAASAQSDRPSEASTTAAKA